MLRLGLIWLLSDGDVSAALDMKPTKVKIMAHVRDLNRARDGRHGCLGLRVAPGSDVRKVYEVGVLHTTVPQLLIVALQVDLAVPEPQLDDNRGGDGSLVELLDLCDLGQLVR
jgi:hypothetical protein